MAAFLGQSVVSGDGGGRRPGRRWRWRRRVAAGTAVSHPGRRAVRRTEARRGTGTGPVRRGLRLPRMLGGSGVPRVTGKKFDIPGVPMPGLGRMSMPVPQPVLVTNWRTGKFLATSGSEPQPGLPPGPPLAATIGQIVRISVRVVAEEQSRRRCTMRAAVSAGGVVAAVVQRPLGAHEQAGVLGVVLHQQVGRRLQDVDRSHQIVLVGADAGRSRCGRTRSC